jgi:hypothetical protein
MATAAAIGHREFCGHRRLFGLVFACFCIEQVSLQAKDVQLFNRDVQINRFASLHSQMQREARPPEAGTLFRLVIGSVDDLCATYENETPITVIHILEFSTNLLLTKPSFLLMCLCRDQDRCINTIGSELWEDTNKW